MVAIVSQRTAQTAANAWLPTRRNNNSEHVALSLILIIYVALSEHANFTRFIDCIRSSPHLIETICALRSWRKMEAAVKAARQFALILAVVLPLMMPSMACALPNAHLSPAEHSCCKRMQGHCGSMASQGCCQMEVPTATNWNATVQIGPANVPVDLAASVALLPALPPAFSVAMPGFMQQPASTLPQSPPSAISVLRI